MGFHSLILGESVPKSHCPATQTRDLICTFLLYLKQYKVKAYCLGRGRLSIVLGARMRPPENNQFLSLDSMKSIAMPKPFTRNVLLSASSRFGNLERGWCGCMNNLSKPLKSSLYIRSSEVAPMWVRDGDDRLELCMQKDQQYKGTPLWSHRFLRNNCYIAFCATPLLEFSCCIACGISSSEHNIFVAACCCHDRTKSPNRVERRGYFRFRR